MPIKTSQEVEFGPESPAEVVIEVGRMDNGEGIKIFVQSKFLHKWFKDRSTGEMEVPEWGLKIFKLAKMPNLPEASLAAPGGPINLDVGINLTWLRSTQLEKGIEVEFEGVVPAEPNINTIYNAIRKGIADLWSNHMRKTLLRARMTFVEMTEVPEAS